MTTPEVALVISFIALLVSVTMLWMNSLKPFNLRVLHDTPTFALYKITPSISGTKDGKIWWIPSFDVGLSFHNLGKIPGEVMDIRIVGEFKGHRSSKTYVFYPQWIVDYPAFQKNRADRMTWTQEAIIRDWYPVLLKGQGEVHLHVILECGRWDQKENGEMLFRLEVISSKKKEWLVKRKYTLHITEDMFEEKSSYAAYDSSVEDLRKL